MREPDAMKRYHYRVKLAADGLEALEIVTQTRCDLVVTDLEMPRTNGYELLSHLRQDAKTRNIPVTSITTRRVSERRLVSAAVAAAVTARSPSRGRAAAAGT